MGTMMAYSLARFNTGGRHLSLWVLSQRFLPPVAIVLPIFLLFRVWGLYDTLTGLILAYTFMTLPLSVWMMVAYFQQLPKSLEEAAWVDGFSRWQTFWMVATPLAAPGVAAAAVFVFIAVWTEFFFALILTSRHAFTLPTVFRAFLGFQGAQYGEACALATTSLAPSIVLGMLVQRHLVRGLTLGAISVWISRARLSLVAAFANGVSKDRAAIEAAISLPWSNGQTEGQICRLKLVKRQMYGRGNLDLLQARVMGLA
jgi:multiple sugar transport system permease protein